MENNKTKIVVFDWGGIIESQDPKDYNHFNWQIDMVRSFSKEKFDDNFILKEWIKTKTDENGLSKKKQTMKTMLTSGFWE